MKAIWIIFILCGTCCITTSYAQHTPVALGVRISSKAPVINTSISARFYKNDNQALEAFLSFDPVAIGAMYERFKPVGAQGLSWFYGGGAYSSLKKPVNAGLQGIIGLDYDFVDIPVNLSVDWKPELSIIHSVNFEPAAVGISARFIFR